MNYKVFMENVKQALERRTRSRHGKIEIRSIVKANDCVKDSISFIEPGRTSSPTVYLNDFYEWHLKGGTIEEISEKILEIIDSCSCDIPEDFRRFEQFDQARSHITMKVLNTQINRAYLEGSAALNYLDLSIVFYCTITTGRKGSVYCSKISRELMEAWGTDLHTLYGLARMNTPRMMGVYLKEVREVILEMLDPEMEEAHGNLIEALNDEDRSPMYILSNDSRNSGAGNMFAGNILNGLAQKLDSDLYLIPSSIHEILAIPVNSKITRDEVDSMVRDVNRTVLRPEDILSDHVYVYQKNEDRIIM